MVERGDIVLVDLEPVKGSEQGRIRPCLVVQNDISNKYSPNTIIVPITSKINDKEYPATVIINPNESGLKEVSSVLCNQIKTISIKHRLIKKLGSLNESKMIKVNSALKVSLGLD